MTQKTMRMNLIKRNKQNWIYAFLTIIVSFVFLYIFYGKILNDPGKYFFANGGDGFKSYYGTFYHYKYDKSYTYTYSQNYPYGDNIFYSDSQPIISNTLKFFNIDCDIVKLLNLLMLFSIPLGSLFIFLLLRRLNMPAVYSLIAAVIIAFMSPQLSRMSGHFSLSYIFFIPLYLYLLHYFFSNKSYYVSILIGIVSFIGLITHAYFFAFFGFFSFFMIIVYTIQDKKNFPFIKTFLPHFTIQIIIPFLLFQLFILGSATDRTSYPWGFFSTNATPESVFLPIGKPYSKFIHFSHVSWEGIAYVGLVVTIVFIIGFINYLINVNKRKWFVLNDNMFLNAALWASLIALFFSFTYPFKWELKWLWNYMGPLKQFRASGRFAWLFFYTSNIIAFYTIGKYYKQKKSIISVVLVIIAVSWGLYDAYLNVKKREQYLAKDIPEIKDINNTLEQNRWINNIDVSKYQAILPIPFFHVGSEVYWISPSSEIKKIAFTVSWKTGLPINAVLLSRTSISQTIKSLAYYFEPLSPFKITKEYPNKKDLLLLYYKNGKTNPNEKRFLKYGTLISENKTYKAYSLPIDSIFKLNDKYRNNIIKKIEETDSLCLNDFISTINTAFIYESFGNIFPEFPYGKSHLTLNAKKNNIIFGTTLFANTDSVYISFWMNNLNKDLIPRSRIKIKRKDFKGHFHQIQIKSVHRCVKYIDSSGWGLVELSYKPKNQYEYIRIELRNNLVTGGEIQVDDVLIRNKHHNVCFNNNDYVYINNRYIKKKTNKIKKDNNEFDIEKYKKQLLVNKIKNNKIKKDKFIIEKYKKQQLIKKIKNNKKWFELIKQKAKKNKRTVEEQLERDVAWMLKQQNK